MLSLAQLLVSLPVQVNESVDEVGDACTYVHKVDDDIFEVEVQGVGHVEAANFISPNSSIDDAM